MGILSNTNIFEFLRMKKKIIILVGLGVFAFILLKFLLAGPRSDGQKKVMGEKQTVAVQKGALRVVVEATGRIVPDLEVEIKCKASGEIIQLPVDVSDQVKRGDLLVQLDPVDEERSVKRAEADLSVSRARLAQAKINLQIAERDFSSERTRANATIASAAVKAKEAKAKLKRAEQLMAKKMASREEMDIAQTARAQAAAELSVAQARVKDLKSKEAQIESKREDIRIAEAQVVSDEIALSDAKQRLADTKVTAPIDGVVTERNVQVGQIIASGINNVGGGTTVMKLADLARIFALVSVDESDIGRIQVGQSALITVDAYPEIVFPGKIVRVATKGTNTSNVVTFEVKAEIQGPKRKFLKPEMTANVEILAVEKENILLIPVTAVQRQRREQFVWINNKDGGRERRIVETGSSDGEKIEIVKGLSEGETVLLPAVENQSRWRSNGESPRNKARETRMRMRVMRRTTK
jgi:HlyD family secretion protein